MDMQTDSGVTACTNLDEERKMKGRKNLEKPTFWLAAALLPWRCWWALLAVLLAMAAQKGHAEKCFIVRNITSDKFSHYYKFNYLYHV